MSKFYRLLFVLYLISFVEIYNYRGCYYMCCNCWKYCFNKKVYLENQRENSFNKISGHLFQNSNNFGLVGLRNPYKSCYMNTALQCLSNCWELTEYFFSNKYKISKEDSLATAYKVVLKHLWLGSEAVFDPVNFRKMAGNYDKKWDGKTQQDTYEFLIFLLKSLHEDLNNSLNKIAQNSLDEVVQSQISWNNFGGGRQSVVDDLFYGEFISTTACPQKNCEDKEKSVSHFLALLLPIPQSTDQKLKEEEKKEVKEEEKKEDNKDKKKEDKKEEKNIDDCLEFFFREEELSKDNELYCEKCKKYRQKIMKKKINKAPKILIIKIKRFKGNSKDNTFISFPINGLDLSKYVFSDKENAKYDLFAIANHQGTMDEGHYFAYCKNPSGWYQYNDNRVLPMSEENLVTNNAYVLFYRRQEENQQLKLN